MKISLISNINEIESFINKSNQIADSFKSDLPFHRLQMSLLWWKHFKCNNGDLFGKKRSKNFFGFQSRLNTFYLIVVKDGDNVCGFAPVASFSVKTQGRKNNIRLISFAGDSVLIPYQDFLVTPQKRIECLSLILTELVDLLKNDHDLLFIGYLPENSYNIQPFQELMLPLKKKGIYFYKTITSRRGGVHPWTIAALIYNFKQIYKKIGNQKIKDTDLNHLIDVLQNTTQQKLLFPATQKKIETQTKKALLDLKCLGNIKNEINAVESLLLPSPVIYPYIKLPSDRETYLMGLSKKTRTSLRYYKNRFIKQGGTFKKIEPDNITESDINDYLTLHSLRWGKESAAIRNSTLNFHKELFQNMAGKGYVTLFFSIFLGKRIAAHSCFDIMSKREAYFTGRDPRYNDLRSGRLLYLETIYDAIENGFKVYDLGYGDDAYKMKFTKTFAHTCNFFVTSDEMSLNLDKIFMGYECMTPTP